MDENHHRQKKVDNSLDRKIPMVLFPTPETPVIKIADGLIIVDFK